MRTILAALVVAVATLILAPFVIVARILRLGGAIVSAAYAPRGELLLVAKLLLAEER